MRERLRFCPKHKDRVEHWRLPERSSSRVFVEYVGLPDETPKLARQADVDVIVNALPLNRKDEGVFDAAMLRG